MEYSARLKKWIDVSSGMPEDRCKEEYVTQRTDSVPKGLLYVSLWAVAPSLKAILVVHLGLWMATRPKIGCMSASGVGGFWGAERLQAGRSQSSLTRNGPQAITYTASEFFWVQLG